MMIFGVGSAIRAFESPAFDSKIGSEIFPAPY
jgi:hypothetical protein